MAVFTLPCQGNEAIGQCISEIYTVSLTLVGIVAFVQIMLGGFLLLTAAGNTSKTGQAMDKIKNAILGIVLLFSSYLILKTINPDLVNFNKDFLPKITQEEKLAHPSDGTRPTISNEPTGSREIAKIERFSAQPSIDLNRTNDNINFSLSIFGSTPKILEQCPAAEEDFNSKYTLWLMEKEGGTPRPFDSSASPTGGNVRKFTFGDGKVLDFQFSQPVAKLRSSIADLSKTSSVIFFTTFSCHLAGRGNQELSRSVLVRVNLFR